MCQLPLDGRRGAKRAAPRQATPGPHGGHGQLDLLVRRRGPIDSQQVAGQILDAGNSLVNASCLTAKVGVHGAYASGVKRRKGCDFLKYHNAAGAFADFHSNRHTFITTLERSGVRPKVAQTLARHSDIRLTLGIYRLVCQTVTCITAIGSRCLPTIHVLRHYSAPDTIDRFRGKPLHVTGSTH